MPGTHVAIYEWNATTKSYVLDVFVPKTASMWEDCLTAIQLAAMKGFHSGQHPGQAIRRPNAWTGAHINIGDAAAGTAWNDATLQKPHVHGGVGKNQRAAIGCKLTPTEAATHWQYMKIYIGQFS